MSKIGRVNVEKRLKILKVKAISPKVACRGKNPSIYFRIVYDKGALVFLIALG